MEAPADLGTQIDPAKAEIGKEYYWKSVLGYKKGVITKIQTDDTNSPFFTIHFRQHDKRMPKIGFNHTKPWATASNKFYEVRDLVKEAQKNILQELGNSGTLPINIAMNLLPMYLGLGGRSKKRRNRRKTKRRSK